MSLSIFKYFGHVIQKTFFSYLHCINETSNTLNYYIPDQRRKETLVTRLTWLCLPPPPPPSLYRLFLGGMGMSAECEVG